MINIRIYLDNGSTTQVDKSVLKAMTPYLSKNYGNPSSLHGFGRDARNAIEQARETIAKKLGAKFEEVIFTASGTESDNLAIKGVAYANKKKGKHIITSSIEHSAVYNSCKKLESEGFKVTYLPVDEEGFVDLKRLEKEIKKDTILVSIIHANNEIGTIQNIREIGDICKKKKVYFHTDAVQSFTKVPINVEHTNIDLLSISAHKIHGPKGVGVLYVKKGTNIQKLIDGGPHEFDMRAGTENVASIVGFGKAVELSLTPGEIENMKNLRNFLIENLLKIPNTKLNGSKNKRICNNVNISFKGVEGESILMHLDSRGIAVSTASACSSTSLKPSRILLAIGLTPEMAHGAIRFTISKYTTKKEIVQTVKQVEDVARYLRGMSPLVRKSERDIFKKSKGRVIKSKECW